MKALHQKVQPMVYLLVILVLLVNSSKVLAMQDSVLKEQPNYSVLPSSVLQTTVAQYRFPCNINQDGNWGKVRNAKKLTNDQLLQKINDVGRTGHTAPGGIKRKAIDLTNNARGDLGSRSWGVCENLDVVAARTGVVAKVMLACGAVWLRHEDGQYSFYLHMVKKSIQNIKVGITTFQMGQKIGVMGDTSSPPSCRAYGVHIHFAVMNAASLDSSHEIALSLWKFSLVNPEPTISNLNYKVVQINSASLKLSVYGSGFTNKSVILWNKQLSLPTTYIGNSELVTTLSSAMLQNAGVFTISVYTPPLGGGMTTTYFVIVDPSKQTRIASAINDQKVIRNVGNISPAIQLWDWLSNVIGEKWYLVSAPIGLPNYYWIISASNLNCLGVTGLNNSPLVQLPCSFGEKQVFLQTRRSTSNGSSALAFQSKYSKKVIDLTGWATQNGTVIGQYDPIFHDNQLWKLSSAPSILTPTPNMCSNSTAISIMQCGSTPTPTTAPIVHLREPLYWNEIHTGSVNTLNFEKWPFLFTDWRAYALSVTRTSGDATFRLTVFDNNGNLLVTSIGSLNVFVTGLHPPANYYAIVEVISGSGTYNISITQPPIATREQMLWGQIYSGSVSASSFEKWPFFFSATRHFQINLNRTGGDAIFRLLVLDSAGHSMIGGEGANTSISNTFPAGNYSVLVQPVSGSGSYTISITQLP